MPKTTRTARIAVVGPFSGPRAAWGELLTRAAEDHQDPDVVWEFHDDRGDAVEAEHVARTLVADPAGAPRAVVGHFNSLGAARALPLYREAGLPVLLPLSTDPDLLRSGGGGALRWCPHDGGQPSAIRRAARVLGHGAPVVVDDGSAYGRRLAGRFRSLPPEPATADTAGDALVVCGTHHGAAATARQLRAEGFTGQLFFTDDCAVAEFAELLGADAGAARVARLAGGAQIRVDAAFEALVRALRADRGASGDRLLAGVRSASGLAFDAAGDPVDADDDAGWEVVPATRLALAAEPPGATAGGAPFAARRAPGPLVGGYDVVVVGAGVVGAATAAALAAAELSVAVAAPLPGPASATSWSGGLIRAYEPDAVVRELAVRSSHLLWGSGDVPTDIGLRRTGSLVLLGPDDLAEAARGVGQLRAAGIKADLLSPAELGERWPDAVADTDAGIAGAVWEPDGGYANPADTADLYLTRALRHGTVRLPPGPVRALEAHRRGVEVVTESFSVTARCAVVAAGGGTPALLGDRLPPRPGGPAPRTKRIRYAFFRHSGRPLPSVSDLTTGMWARPQLDGPYAGCQLTGRPVDEWDVAPWGGDAVTEEQIAHIRAGATHRWPWIADASCLGGRFGTDLYHPDGPFVGLLPGGPPVVVAACWSGAGFKTAPGAAEQAAAAVQFLLR